MKIMCIRGHNIQICGRTKIGQCNECRKSRQTENQKKHQLKFNYGLSLNEYNRLFQIQGGCCKICKTHQSELKHSLAVDHNHQTQAIRGLLCSNCNAGLGFFKDNPERMSAAIEYIKS